VVAAQTHDQVGNRAGERNAALTSDGRLRVAAALLLAAPFVPMLFQGEEWGAGTPFPYFTDHSDPGLGRTVSEGRRHEFAAFGWDPARVPDPQDPATFERSRLDWAELREQPHTACWPGTAS
jgi:maltooligosyltrehalose trehalohydrolase